MTEWGSSAEIQNRSIENIGEGAYATVAFVFEVWTGEGEVDLRAESRVYDSGGSRVASKSKIDDQLTEAGGFKTYSWSFVFDSREWAKDTYSAEILIRDRRQGLTSETATVEFDIVDDLTEGEAEIVRYEGPEQPTAGEEFSFDVVLRNLSNRDSSLVTTVSENRNGEGWTKLSGKARVDIPGNDGEATYSNQWTLYEPGNYQFRFDTIDESWGLTVEESEE